MKFGSADFVAEKEAQVLPSFPLFLARVFLHDVFAVGMLPITGVLVYAILHTLFLGLGAHAVVSPLLALILVPVVLVTSCVVLKRVVVGSQWGSAHSTPFWSLRHFSYFFAQDCFFAWCGRVMRALAGTVLPNLVLRRMGCRVGRRTIVTAPLQAFDWNAVSFGDDCMIVGLLQFHSFENMTLKVKRTEIQDGSSVGFGATVMGGAVIESESVVQPLSMVMKGMRLPTATYEGNPAELARTLTR
ncbi:hypothetical protein DRQ32_10785 [bacterium]|nr:MAG: hypothetical protein DRQ32_10785 [bacterium]